MVPLLFHLDTGTRGLLEWLPKNKKAVQIKPRRLSLLIYNKDVQYRGIQITKRVRISYGWKKFRCQIVLFSGHQSVLINETHFCLAKSMAMS